MDDKQINCAEFGEIRMRAVNYTPLEAQTRHCHDVTTATLIVSGALEEGTNRGIHIGQVCSVVVKPAGVYHENRYGPRGTRTFQVIFESAVTDAPAGPLDYAWYHGGPVTRIMLSILQLVRNPGPRDHTTLGHGVLDLLVCIGEPERDSARVRPRWIAELTRELDETVPEAVSVRSLAEAGRMHPVSLARAFRRHHGCSITEYVRRRRILAACQMLDAEADSLAEVALAAGFADQPHFTRAFKAETGLTPARFRRTVG